MLHKLRKDYDDHYKNSMEKKYNKRIDQGESMFSAKTMTSTAGTKTSEQEEQAPPTEHAGKKEQMARTVAACSGKFHDVEYPWPRAERFDGADFSYQQGSPFYFWGQSNKTNETVFLKVWQAEDGFDLCDITTEFKFLNHANTCGVPVAAPMMDCVHEGEVEGETFFVTATEYVVRHAPCSVDEVAQYSQSLMQSVDCLHKQAGIVHCDLKPGNVIWDKPNNIVKLIDFGRSQWEENAKSNRGTRGFEAPEVVDNKEANSRQSDAYSVGKTIHWVLDKLERSDLGDTTLLREVADGLSNVDVETRWSLDRALRVLMGEPEPKLLSPGASSSVVVVTPEDAKFSDLPPNFREQRRKECLH